MTVTAILGVIIAGLAAVVGLLAKLWRGTAADAARQKAERDAQALARTDDAGRFEAVIAAKNAAAAEAAKNVPSDVQGVRDAVTKLGGVPLPPPKGKP